jgi:tRNA pseudouridine38-40 synthase
VTRSESTTRTTGGWWAGATRSPLRARNVQRVAQTLDRAAIYNAAKYFVGTHDFACLQAAGSATLTTVRTLWRVELAEVGDGTLRLDVEGDGFLRHMVRNLAGTLLEVGTGRRAADSIPQLLKGRDRRRAGATAPAQGLLLVSVRYDPPIVWEAGDR